MGYDGPTWDQDEAKMGATSQRCVAQRLRVEFRGARQKALYIQTPDQPHSADPYYIILYIIYYILYIIYYILYIIYYILYIIYYILYIIYYILYIIYY